MKKHTLLFAFTALLCLPMIASATDYSEANRYPTKPKPVPLDGGLTLLAAAGIGYGVKRIVAKKKNNDK
jgi:hypothetical protein